MNYDDFVQRVQERTGLETREAAARAVAVTMGALRRSLDAPTLRLATSLVPPPLDRMLGRGPLGDEGPDPHEPAMFFEDVAEHEHVSIGFAKEHSAVVFEELAATLDPDDRERLRRHLPTELSVLLAPPEVPLRPPPISPPVRSERVTLAGGAAGSRHPLSEAAPPTRAHAGSVARSDDPHADRRLSSAHGAGTEHSVAGGRAGSSRPISEGRG
jgi:uncharacterized protein (DUF2267 family)